MKHVLKNFLKYFFWNFKILFLNFGPFDLFFIDLASRDPRDQNFCHFCFLPINFGSFLAACKH